MAPVFNAGGYKTAYGYDKVGNVVAVTEYTYSALDMVTHINYNGGKQVNYQYNKVGDLVKNYTGHDYDSVLSQYYAKARMYDAGDRRFTAVSIYI